MASDSSALARRIATSCPAPEALPRPYRGAAMSKADQFLLSDSEPDSPKHGSDAVGTASEAAAASKPAAPVPPPPAPAAPAVEPPPQQVTMELEAKGVKLTELYNKAIESVRARRHPATAH